MVSRLTDEKASAIEQNQKLRQELVCFSYLMITLYLAFALSIVINCHMINSIFILTYSFKCLVC